MAGLLKLKFSASDDDLFMETDPVQMFRTAIKFARLLEDGRRVENMSWRLTFLRLTLPGVGDKFSDSRRVGSRIKTLAPQFDDGVFLHTTVTPIVVQEGMGAARPFVDVEIHNSLGSAGRSSSPSISELSDGQGNPSKYMWSSPGMAERRRNAEAMLDYDPSPDIDSWADPTTQMSGSLGAMGLPPPEPERDRKQVIENLLTLAGFGISQTPPRSRFSSLSSNGSSSPPSSRSEVPITPIQTSPNPKPPTTRAGVKRWLSAKDLFSPSSGSTANAPGPPELRTGPPTTDPPFFKDDPYTSTPVLRREGACTPCRRRKMNCDGAQPICGPCSWVGTDDECSYREPPITRYTDVGVERSQSPQSPARGSWRKRHNPRFKNRSTPEPESPRSQRRSRPGSRNDSISEGYLSGGHLSEGHQSPEEDGESRKKVDWYDV